MQKSIITQGAITDNEGKNLNWQKFIRIRK